MNRFETYRKPDEKLLPSLEWRCSEVLMHGRSGEWDLNTPDFYEMLAVDMMLTAAGSSA